MGYFRVLLLQIKQLTIVHGRGFFFFFLILFKWLHMSKTATTGRFVPSSLTLLPASTAVQVHLTQEVIKGVSVRTLQTLLVLLEAEGDGQLHHGLVVSVWRDVQHGGEAFGSGQQRLQGRGVPIVHILCRLQDHGLGLQGGDTREEDYITPVCYT